MGRKWSRTGPKQLRRLQCRLAQSSQAVLTGTLTPVLYATEVDDPYDLHSTSVNTDRITVTRPGWYRLQQTGAIPAVSTIIYMEFTKNGTLFSTTRQPGNTNEAEIVTQDVLLAAGDFIRTVFFHGAGTTQTLTSTFEVTWLRPGP